MTKIVESVTRVTDIMAHIATASDEQSKGISQVSIAVAEMDKVTQQNASLVEQSAVAANVLEEQVAKLSQLIAIFRLPALKHKDDKHTEPAARTISNVVKTRISAKYHRRIIKMMTIGKLLTTRLCFALSGKPDGAFVHHSDNNNRSR